MISVSLRACARTAPQISMQELPSLPGTAELEDDSWSFRKYGSTIWPGFWACRSTDQLGPGMKCHSCGNVRRSGWRAQCLHWANDIDIAQLWTWTDPKDLLISSTLTAKYGTQECTGRHCAHLWTLSLWPIYIEFKSFQPAACVCAKVPMTESRTSPGWRMWVG